MTRHPVRMAVCMSLVGVVASTLAACGGGGGGGKPHNAISGAGRPSVSASSATPAPSASPADASGRPVIDLPAGIDTFSGWTSSDAKRAAALRDTADSIRAVDAAIVDGKASTPAMRFYLTDRAYEGAVTWVQSALKAHITIGGSIRYFRPRFSTLDHGALGLTYCGDETHAYNKDRRTGKRAAQKKVSHADSFAFYNVRLVRTKSGVWQTVDMVSERGSAKCL
jgi:hypothetical protein